MINSYRRALLVSFAQLLCAGYVVSGEPLFEKKDVFIGGLDGVVEYRIPGVVTTNRGTLVAVCDARVERPGDAINNIDLVMKRSIDAGRTWERMQVLADFPGQQAAADPCITLDRQAGTIWLLYDHCLAELDKSGERKREKRVISLHLVHSRDDGQTWSQPVNITERIKRPDWEAVLGAPGRGMQTRAGELVLPCYTRRADGDYSHVLVSDDHGATWRISSAAASPTNECAVVELTDGSWMLNMRSDRGQASRAVATTRDRGDTWTDVVDAKSLPEPRCQASFLRYTDTRDGYRKNRLLFSNPADTAKRSNMTVRLSYDEGQTWPVSKTIYRGPSAYSCLTALGDGTIGLLYENGERSPYERITFARFNLEWLTDGQDQLQNPN